MNLSGMSQNKLRESRTGHSGIREWACFCAGGTFFAHPHGVPAMHLATMTVECAASRNPRVPNIGGTSHESSKMTRALAHSTAAHSGGQAAAPGGWVSHEALQEGGLRPHWFTGFLCCILVMAGPAPGCSGKGVSRDASSSGMHLVPGVLCPTFCAPHSRFQTSYTTRLY